MRIYGSKWLFVETPCCCRNNWSQEASYIFSQPGVHSWVSSLRRVPIHSLRGDSGISKKEQTVFMENHEIDEDEKQKQLKFQMNCCSKIQGLQSNLFKDIRTRPLHHRQTLATELCNLQRGCCSRCFQCKHISSANIFPVHSYFQCKYISSAKL